MEDLVVIDSDGIIFADTESRAVEKIEKGKPVSEGILSFEVPKEVIVRLPIELPKELNR